MCVGVVMKPVTVLFGYNRAGQFVDAAEAMFYDEQRTINENREALRAVGFEMIWVPVTVDTVEEVVSALDIGAPVLNYCDGDDELHPGVSVVRALEERNARVTGASAAFFDISSSKLAMKVGCASHRA